MLLSVGSTRVSSSARRSLQDPGMREASSAPPSPSRHDPWRFLRVRCVWIGVIAIAIMRIAHSLGGALSALQAAGRPTDRTRRPECA